MTANPTDTSLNLNRATPAHQAFRILQMGFIAAPILAGLDKFFHLLVNWDQYMPSVVARLSPIGKIRLRHLIEKALRELDISSSTVRLRPPRAAGGRP